jgi:N-methylhydantoinase A
LLEELRIEADAWLAAEQVPVAERSFDAVALMRYEGQGGELAVTWAGTAPAALAAFRDAHQALYRFTMEAPVELVTLRVEATGRVRTAAIPYLETMPAPEPRETRIVYFATGSVTVPVLAREALGAGTCFDGPAIVSQLDATTLVPPGWRVEVHAAGSMLLRRD